MSHQTTHRLVDPAGLTLDSLTNLLQRGGADISAFGVGQARSLAEFRDEVRDGKVALSVAAGDGSVQRTLGVVAVLVERTASRKVQTWLLQAGISLVINVKVGHRIPATICSRTAVGAVIVSSDDI